MVTPPCLGWLFTNPFGIPQKETEPEEKREKKVLTANMVDFLAGCLGGMAGVIVGHPLDTVKVHMQTHGAQKYGGTWGCMTTLVREENIRSLYKGITSPMAGIGLVNAVVFGVYGNINRNFKDPQSLTSHLIAGSAAGLIQSLISSPMELAKTRMQLQHGQTHFKGPYDCIRYIWRTEGVRGTFRGLTMTALRDVPGFASYFVSYEYFMRIPKRETGLWTLLAGGLAGMVSWICCYPFDVLKTCLQADGHSPTSKYKGGLDCAIKNYQSHGYKYFFRGINSTLIRAFPANAACFFVVAFVLRLTKGKSFDLVVNANEPWAVVSVEPTPLCHMHQIDCDDREMQQKRLTMARNLRALGAFNEAVHHNEADELANDLYPDSHKYYIYEDKRLSGVRRTSDSRLEQIQC